MTDADAADSVDDDRKAPAVTRNLVLGPTHLFEHGSAVSFGFESDFVRGAVEELHDVAFASSPVGVCRSGARHRVEEHGRTGEPDLDRDRCATVDGPTTEVGTEFPRIVLVERCKPQPPHLFADPIEVPASSRQRSERPLRRARGRDARR